MSKSLCSMMLLSLHIYRQIQLLLLAFLADFILKWVKVRAIDFVWGQKIIKLNNTLIPHTVDANFELLAQRCKIDWDKTVLWKDGQVRSFCI